MKIHIAKYDPERQGGGWAWQQNFTKEVQHYDYKEADVYLIAGASMVDKQEVRQAKEDGKRIVLRADNMPRNSRNRNSGSSRLKLYSELADLVIFQSKWAYDFLQPYLQVSEAKTAVILNGVDQTIYNPNKHQQDEDTYLYVRSSRDEGKMWIAAWYWFVNNKGRLDIVGKFSDENMEYNFDFFNNEQFRFYGSQENMIDFYNKNKYFLYTYLNDACSNTLIEALSSGCEVIDVYGMAKTGGAPEILSAFEIRGRDYLSSKRMAVEYMEVIDG